MNCVPFFLDWAHVLFILWSQRPTTYCRMSIGFLILHTHGVTQYTELHPTPNNITIVSEGNITRSILILNWSSGSEPGCTMDIFGLEVYGVCESMHAMHTYIPLYIYTRHPPSPVQFVDQNGKWELSPQNLGEGGVCRMHKYKGV